MQLVSDKQIKLKSSLEALSDILVAETKTKKEKRVLSHLEQLHGHTENIFELDRNAFEKLMLNPDSNGNSHFLFWDPESYSYPFAALMKLYTNIYQVSIDTNNQKIELQAAIGLNQILDLICPVPIKEKNFIKYEAFLDLFFSEHRKLFRYSIKIEDLSSHSLAYHWYTNHVFNNYIENNVMNLRFFKYFNTKLFEYLLYAIDNANDDWFREFVSWMHHGIGFLDETYSGLYDFVGYGDYQSFTFKDIEKLEQEFNSIRKQEDLELWLEKFEEIKKVVLHKFANHEAAEEIEKKVYQQYFFSVLKQLIHGLSAYLVYKERFQCIKELWEFKQPQGSLAHWIGHSIISESIPELIELFNPLHEKNFCFRDEHVDCERYMHIYELCRLIYFISKEGYQQPSSFTSSTDEVYLSNLKHYAEKLDNEVDDVLQKTELLEKLDFNNDRGELAVKLHEVFASIQKECDSKIDKSIIEAGLLESRIEEFKKGFIESYRKSRGIKDLFKYYSMYSEQLSEIKRSQSFGINTLVPKEVFNSRMTIGVDMFGSDFARNIIIGEQKNIIDKLIQYSIAKNENDFDSIFSQIRPENSFIVAFQSRNFMKEKNFTGAWKSEKKIDFPSFEGWYSFEENSIPVFSYSGYKRGQYLVLDKSHLPQIVQYTTVDSADIVDEFFISISDLKNKPDLIEHILRRDTTATEADIKKRKRELLKKVQVEIYESFEVLINDNFIGFVVDSGE